MLDKEYFTMHLPSQIESHFGAGNATVRLFLVDGSNFSVYQIVSALDNYVILAVYSEKVNDEEIGARRKTDDPTKTVHWDHVAIPYFGIARVLVTMTGPGSHRLGFHP